MQCFHNAINQSSWGLFSFLCNEYGLLKRYKFAILVDSGNCSETKTALELKNKIIDRGGFASVVTTPDISKKVINIVIGQTMQSWGKYLINLYSANLVVEAIRKETFDPTGIHDFLIPQPDPVNFNISFISQHI